MQTRQILLGYVLALICSAAGAEPDPAQQESIVFDPQTGNYVITYEAEGQWHQAVFVPGNKIVPTIRSRFKTNQGGAIRYRYEIRSGKESRQDISLFMLIASNADPDSLRVPHDWDGSITPAWTKPGVRASWSYWGDGKPAGIPPGGHLSGFGFDSPDLPGIGIVALKGRTPILGFAGHGPGLEVSNKLAEIEATKNGVALPAAIPGIPVAEPFDPAAILTGLRRHLDKDLVEIDQIDPVFAAQLGRLFQAAIDAINQGNLVAARGEIRELRRLLHREHKGLDEDEEDRHGRPEEDERRKDKSGLITRLAARVLEFDLKYVENRLNKGDHGD